MGTPHERDDSIRISRRTLVLGAGTTAILGIGYLLGSRRGDPIPVYVVQQTLTPNPARTTATRTIPPNEFPIVSNLSYNVEYKTSDVPDKDGVILNAKEISRLIFTATPDRVLEEFSKIARDEFARLPNSKESMVRAINGVKEGVRECGATITRFSIATRQSGTAKDVQVGLDRYCYSQFGYQPGNSFQVSYQKDIGGPNPDAWKPFFIAY